ncbi:MAG: hypothetical protein IJ538_03940 [Clostridia bacterium]|nr:hypothetical protein [Clostridia bacterium]
MKKLLKTFLAFVLIIPVIIFSACSKSGVESKNVSAYFNENVSANVFNDSDRKLPLSVLTSSSANTDYLDKFTSFTLSGKNAWIYKMYIEKITFSVYSEGTASGPLTVSLTLTNCVDESALKNRTSGEAVDTSTPFSTESSAITKNKGSIDYEITINKVIATAGATTLTLDIFESVNETVANGKGEATNFKWMIYNFKVFGESRTYSN